MAVELPCPHLFKKSRSEKYVFLYSFTERVYLQCFRCPSLSDFCNCFFLNFMCLKYFPSRKEVYQLTDKQFQSLKNYLLELFSKVGST